MPSVINGSTLDGRESPLRNRSVCLQSLLVRPRGSCGTAFRLSLMALSNDVREELRSRTVVQDQCRREARGMGSYVSLAQSPNFAKGHNMPESFTQRLFKRLLPTSWSTSMEADSRQWMLRCPCGQEQSVWERGGIRWKASGNPKRLLPCTKCGQNTWHECYYKSA